MSPEDATAAPDPVAAVEHSRRDYALGSLDIADVHPDPLRQLERWIADAVAAEVGEPNAMTLATVDAEGSPDARIVLLRRITAGSLVWFTDRTSTKGEQLAATPAAALVFHWQPLERQVRLRGQVTPLDDARSDEYFASRPRGSQLSAWASSQSRTVASREDYERQVVEVEARFDGVDLVPRPPHWGGYELTPTEVEFWQGRRSRRHDRLRFLPAGGTGAGATSHGWRIERLQP
jgi:pyridoxamine 5'-phosphate oxidase